MKTLEEILQEYFDCDKPIGMDGKMTKWGDRAYDKLISTLYEVSTLTGKNNIDDIIESLDEIYNE